MYLPERLQDRSFVEWNYLVQGIMEIWELARFYGVEECLEERLRHDHDATLAIWLGQVGNELRAIRRERLREQTLPRALGPLRLNPSVLLPTSYDVYIQQY